MAADENGFSLYTRKVTAKHRPDVAIHQFGSGNAKIEQNRV